MLLGSVRMAARPITVDPVTVSEPPVSVSDEGFVSRVLVIHVQFAANVDRVRCPAIVRTPGPLRPM